MYKAPTLPAEQMLRIDRFSGVNLSNDPTQIEDTESTEMLNVILDKDGTPDKRTGFEKAFETALGTGKINGLFAYNGAVIAYGTKLYSWDLEGAPTEIYAGVTDAAADAFVYDGKLYIINGHEFLVYDGTTVAVVTPYIPTLYITSPPAGGGTEFEMWNLIGTGFKQQFVGDGNATTYVLWTTGLDATLVTIQVVDSSGAHDLTEGTHFTVDRTKTPAAEIDFTGGTDPWGAPASAGGEGNVTVTAYKDFDVADKILGCTRWNIYGGNNDTRVHLFGNSDYPSIVFRSGTADPTYWPDEAWNEYGSTEVTAKVNQYDTSVVFGEDGIYQEYIDTLDDGLIVFRNKPLNGQTGCIAPKSVQLIENSPFFLSRNGVYSLVSSSVRDERNVRLMSEKINSDLLERDLESAISVEWGDKYLLAFPDGYVWVYQYRLEAWYLWSNIVADCFLAVNGTLYFGRAGMVYRFKTVDDSAPYNDDGAAIESTLSTKVFTFGVETYTKRIHSIHVALRAGTQVATAVYYRSDYYSQWQYLRTFFATLFSYLTLDYSRFTYFGSTLPQNRRKKLGVKNAVYFQVKFENKELNSSMGLLGLGIFYSLRREVR